MQMGIRSAEIAAVDDVTPHAQKRHSSPSFTVTLSGGRKYDQTFKELIENKYLHKVVSPNLHRIFLFWNGAR